MSASQGRKRSIRQSGVSSIEVNISRAIRNSVIIDCAGRVESTIDYRKYFPGKLIFGSWRSVHGMIRRVTWDAGDAYRRPW